MNTGMLALFTGLLPLLNASLMVENKKEQLYQEYFQGSKEACLFNPAKHPYFRTFEEHDLSNYWGLFQLPIDEEEISVESDAKIIYCSGDCIYSLSHLLDYSLEIAMEELSATANESYRLGFFKLYENRTNFQFFDGLLHHKNGGGRLNLLVEGYDSKNESSYLQVVRDAFRFLADEFKWSKHFVGLTVTSPFMPEINIEIWTEADVSFMDLRLMKKDIDALNINGITFKTAPPRLVEENSNDAKLVASKFISPEKNESSDVTDLQALPQEWIAFAAAYPQTKKGGFEKARLISQRTSIIETEHDLDRIFSEKLDTFPGILAMNSYTCFYRNSELPDKALDDVILKGKLFDVQYLPAIHKPFSITLSNLSSYTLYSKACFLIVKHVMTSQNASIIDAAFIHFDAKKGDSPKNAHLEVEFWAKARVNKNQQNVFRNGLQIYLANNLLE